MDINLNITLKLDPSVVALLTGLTALAPQRDLTAAPNGGEEPKRGRKSKDAAPAATPEPSPAPPALAIVAPSTAKASAAVLTLKDITDLVTDTLDKCGTPTMRGIFAKWKVAKLSELKQESYADFAAALNEARDMVS